MQNLQQQPVMTCGEYLNSQRRELLGIHDLGAPGAVAKAEDCLSNIYAVSYQMNFERTQPPSSHRPPAESEILDRDLVTEISDGVKNKVHAFREITADPWRLSEAMQRAQQGNGFPLIEMVNMAVLARTARQPQAAPQPQAQLKQPAPGAARQEPQAPAPAL